MVFQIIQKGAEPPPPPSAAAAAAGICSGQLDEENPSTPISSSLLVQADEGVSLPVMDLIDFGLQCPTSPLLPPRKVPLEDLIYTSCTDPILQPTAGRTPRLYQPSAVTHLFYAYVRKATNTEFNVVVLGRDLILYWV
ncbi:hypothetical protein F511_23768 [Dorcoceras hygrometricum]|uniref:Uncharacterized protein n=1 Tax=Dorcoceras hygrometricum TaxID=472368 RepID=A0A2Z7B6Y1_9LAMI|nr:hypothetical protein F511_23768 [Dorcoceras hygrometricum]